MPDLDPVSLRARAAAHRARAAALDVEPAANPRQAAMYATDARVNRELATALDRRATRQETTRMTTVTDHALTDTDRHEQAAMLRARARAERRTALADRDTAHAYTLQAERREEEAADLERQAADLERRPAPAPVTDLAHVEVIDPAAWSGYGDADVRPCLDAGVHRRFQRHPKDVCPLHVPGTPMGE